MRWLALLCWLGAATALAPCAFVADQPTTESDRILHLMNDGFVSAPVGEEFNAPNAPTDTGYASVKEPPHSLPERVHGGIQ